LFPLEKGNFVEAPRFYLKNALARAALRNEGAAKLKVCAVVCEYNPLHKGHARHLERARALSGADFLLCLLSGPFTQRGEPAIFDKWTRARAALLSGADLVLELPALFALRAAPDFGLGAVSLLERLQVVHSLSFGSEIADLSQLYALSAPESPEVSQKIKEALKKGHSYPRAYALARGFELPANALLGLSYIRALQALRSPILPLPVLRLEGHGQAGSSSAIRKGLLLGEEAALSACPPHLLPLYEAARANQGGWLFLPAFDQLLLMRLREMAPETLNLVPGLSEGLGHRVRREALRSGSIEGLLAALRTRRYSAARLRRALLHALLGFDAALLTAHPHPAYARLLGFRRAAQPLLSAIAKNSKIPLIEKAAHFKADPLFALDAAAQDLWSLALPNPAARAAGRDFSTSPVIV
jgi:predicted nucleotidyltransferase